MSEENAIQSLKPNRFSANDEIISLRKLMARVISRKYLFIGTFITAIFIGYLYNSLTIPVYKVSADLLIEEDKKADASGNDQLLEGFGLMPGMKNLDNQIMVLSSRSLVSKTLNELQIGTMFYFKGYNKIKSVYPARPLDIIYETNTQLPKDVEFTFKYLGKNMFRLDAESDGLFELHRKAAFGQKINFAGASFRIERKDYGWFINENKKKICFTFPSHRALVANYIKRLKIEPVSKKGTIVKISIEGTNKIEDLAFLTRLCDIFLNISLEKKNNEAVRTIQFIDGQLAGISDSLVITENKLQRFRSRNKVMNISAQGQVIIDQAVNLENERGRLGIEAKYYEYLSEYLSKDVTGEVPIAPATMEIVDPGLTKLVSDLSEAQRQLYSKSMGDKNPLQGLLSQRVQKIKEALEETLKGVMQANSLAIKENQDQIDAINEKASNLPKTERELLGIERKYKINDELFTFLLQKRALAQMQKASNLADNEIVDYPDFENNPISPKKNFTYIIAFISGIGLPFLWMFMVEIVNFRIRDPREIIKISDLPLTGYIPHSTLKTNMVVLTEPDSPVSEAFKLLRYKMMFFTKEVISPVILVTSSMPEEGKSFTSLNLASVYSLIGKKTVLVEFDLRKPKMYSTFRLDNRHGVSTWLIGKDKLEDIIRKTKNENLSVITAGPVPPNPAELTSLEKTSELFNLLKQKFDCIIVDTSPVGSVSDTFHLALLADACILVVRQNITFKDLLEETVKDLKNSNVKGLSILVNDVPGGSRLNGYNGRYQYPYKSKQSTNKFISTISENRKFFRTYLKSSFRKKSGSKI